MQLSLLLGGHLRQRRQIEGRMTSGMKNLVIRPFQPGDVGQIDQFSRGRERFEKRREKFAKLVQIAGTGWMAGDILRCRIVKKFIANQSTHHRIDRFQRAGQAEQAVIAIDLQPPNAAQTGGPDVAVESVLLVVEHGGGETQLQFTQPQHNVPPESHPPVQLLRPALPVRAGRYPIRLT